MHELKLMAVGSDELIADEIKAIMESFIEGAIPIETILTAEVKGVDPEAFYVCATTQEALLAQRIPKEQLFVFDLHPTEEFFAAIARIPSKEDIYVFNNHAAYIRLLSQNPIIKTIPENTMRMPMRTGPTAAHFFLMVSSSN